MKETYPLALIVKLAEKYNPTGDLSLIEKAYHLSWSSHQDQLRKSGEPYFCHPYNVAKMTAIHKLDIPSICAALLHDVLEEKREDYHALYHQIANNLSPEIARIVEGLTYLESETRDEQTETPKNINKVFSLLDKTSHDLRILLVKMFDRYDNIKTIDIFNRAKMERIAQDTLDIFIPIARQLGLFHLSRKMEDILFRYRYPELRDFIFEELKSRMKEYKKSLLTLKKQLQRTLGRAFSPPPLIYTSRKNLYEIFELAGGAKKKRKLLESMRSQSLFRVLIIVPDAASCYQAFGMVHKRFHHIPQKIRDFIGEPKRNGYRGLHSVIKTERDLYLHVVIRDKDMQEYAKYGVISLLRRKGKLPMNWLKDIMSDRDGLENNKAELQYLFSDFKEPEMSIFTPKHERVSLPEGSIALDFAYSIHSDLGSHMAKAVVDGQERSPTYRLHDGESVEVITNTSSQPLPEYYGSLKTKEAKIQMRRYFRNQYPGHFAIRQSLAPIGKFLSKYGINLPNAELADVLKKTALHMKFASFSQFSTQYLTGFLHLPSIMVSIIGFLPQDMLAAFEINLQKRNILNHKLSAKLEKRKGHPGKYLVVLRHVLQDYLNKMYPREDYIRIQDVLYPPRMILKNCCQPRFKEAIVAKGERGGAELAIHRRTCSNIKHHLALGLPTLRAAEWLKKPKLTRFKSCDIQLKRKMDIYRIIDILSQRKVSVVQLDYHNHTFGRRIAFTIDVYPYFDLQGLAQHLSQYTKNKHVYFSETS